MADVSSTTTPTSSRLIHTTHMDRLSKSKSMSSSTTPKHPAAVARRNARERNRVRQVNMGFVTLRNHIPQAGSKSKKLSKVETLRQAANYIQYLRDTLSVNDPMNSVFTSTANNASCTATAEHGQSYFYHTSSPPVGSGDQYFNGTPSPYQANQYSETQLNVAQHAHPKSVHYNALSVSSHLKISPSSSSTDSPQSGNSFISTSSNEMGNTYECVTPPQMRQYAQEFTDHHPNTPYHRLSHCQNSMPMYS